MKKILVMFHSRALLWILVLVILAGTVATVSGVLPTISLNSPTTFPVDI